jgi:hypothetical protein
MMYVCVCIVCICLYFLQQKLLGASIQTHSARYIQFIQNTYKIKRKYSTNTYKYMQIQTQKIKNLLFFRLVFSVCILFVFVCIVSILMYVFFKYMSHTLELLCACMCMYCMYVHVFFSMHFLQTCQSDFLGGKHVQSVFSSSHDKLIFCWWVNVCMCLYCMYVYVSYVYVCIVAAGTRITAASPNDRLLRRHPAGLTQGIPGHGRKHFFPPSLYPRTTRFRAPPPSSPVGGP